MTSKLLYFLAESKGFEPLVLLQTMVFKTTAFDRSANSPMQIYEVFLDCK